MEKDIEKLKSEAAKGDAKSQFSLGWEYYCGETIPKNLDLAIYWFRQSAERGNKDALNNIGRLYLFGRGVEQDYDKAEKLLKKAKEQGSIKALNNLGLLCEYRGDFEAALLYYTEAAEKGNAEAQFNLGLSYKRGDIVPQDYEKAVMWYRKSAEQGDTNAQVNLGIMYEDGRGVTQSFEEAVKWYRIAAENNDPKGLSNLGRMYKYGLGVNKDVDEARKWLEKAEASGKLNAETELEEIEEDDKKGCVFTRNADIDCEPLGFGPDDVYHYLRSHLDFDLPENMWKHISDGFSLYWNVEATVGGYYDNIYCCQSIQEYLRQRNMIYPPERLQAIVDNILDYADLCSEDLKYDEFRNENEIVLLSDSLNMEAGKTLSSLTNIFAVHGVAYQMLNDVKNIWLRDYMPIELPNGVYASYRYNPDYLRKFKCHQSEIVDWKKCVGSVCLDIKDGLKDVVIDGGNVVRCGDYVVMTAKVFEENPGYTPTRLTTLIEDTLKAQLIVLPWDTKEIFGHSDGILRYVGDGRVLMTNYRQFDRKMAERFVNCLKPYFEVVELKFDVEKLDKRSWVYINWLQTVKVLVVPRLNIPEDEQALRQIEMAFPEYRGRIEMADVTELVESGGGLNCCSWVYKK